MRPLFSYGARVPIGRVLREHRAALLPLGLLLIANVVALAVILLPLSRRVATNEARAEAAERQQAAANAEFTKAETVRESKARASSDLETFYKQVLPGDVTAAQRMTHLRFQQKAREHSVQFQRGDTSEDQERGSVLKRLTSSMTLSGDYDDIRALLFDLETSPEFIVIENVVLTQGSDADAGLSVELQVSTYYRAGLAPAVPARANGR